MQAPLVFHSGFDSYTDPLIEWDTTFGNARHTVEAPGRFGYAQRLTMGYDVGALVKYFGGGPYARVVIGAAIQVSGSFAPQGPYAVIALIDSTGLPFGSIGLNALGRISIVSSAPLTGGTVVASSAALAYPTQSYFYLEADITPGGTVIVRVNGAEVVRATTVAFTSPQVYGFGLCGFGYEPDFWYDDVYVLGETTATGSGDSFYGDVKSVTILPTADGHTSNFVPVGNAAGVTTHFTCVADNPPDGNTTYVKSNVPGAVDFYSVQNPASITPVDAIIGVSVYALAEKDDSPARFLSCGVSDGTTDSFDAGSALGSAYRYVERVLPKNPITGNAWTLADFATLQVGVKVVS